MQNFWNVPIEDAYVVARMEGVPKIGKITEIQSPTQVIAWFGEPSHTWKVAPLYVGTFSQVLDWIQGDRRGSPYASVCFV
jgi:hypothetical protein